MTAAAEYPARDDDTSRDDREFGRPQESAESNAPIHQEREDNGEETAEERAQREAAERDQLSRQPEYDDE